MAGQVAQDINEIKRRKDLGEGVCVCVLLWCDLASVPVCECVSVSV